MPERGGPNVYSIAAHRGFADALVAGLGPRYGEDGFGLARLTLLLPNRRAARTLTEAFIRARPAEVGGGLLLPRMAVVGDLDLDETLGPLLDPLLEGSAIPPAADPVRRWLRLAQFIAEVQGSKAPRGAGLLRLAFETGRTMDRLLAEGIAPDDLMSPEIIGLVQEHQKHWVDSTADFLRVQAYWLADLTARGEVDAPTRRNLLFEGAARRWQAEPPPHPIVAAGVTNASPALGSLLRVGSELPGGAGMLPGLDLTLDKDGGDGLGQAGRAGAAGGERRGRRLGPLIAGHLRGLQRRLRRSAGAEQIPPARHGPLRPGAAGRGHHLVAIWAAPTLHPAELHLSFDR